MQTLTKPITLVCACCGKYTVGRQFWNQDRGFGLCPECATWIAEREGTTLGVESAYGVDGIHYNIK